MKNLIPFLLLLIISCSSKKDILFIQDSIASSEYDIKYSEIKIMPDDILRIKISSLSPEIAGIFSFNENFTSPSIEGYQVNGYMVNSDGFLKIPLVNPIYVKGLTISEISSLIQKILAEEGLLLNSTVDVKIVNAYFTVLGEVNRPGRYNFIENNMDIFKALGIAGDLTINGRRDDIKILKKFEGKLKINSVDITSTKVLSNESFQIFPGDVIIVNANNARVKNAGIIGNFGNLLSVLSFVLSSLILISNN